MGYGDTGITGQSSRAAQGLPAFATPNIDSIALAGARFNNMYSGAISCSPSRNSLLTGFHVAHTYFDRAIDIQDIRGGALDATWGQVLQQAGYKTGLFGKWHLGGFVNTVRAPWAIPTQKGFETVFSAGYRFPTLWQSDGFGGMQKATTPLDPSYTGPGAPYAWGEDMVANRAVQFIRDRAGAQQPFAAYVPFLAPHTPLNYVPPNHPYASMPWSQAHRDYAGLMYNLDQNVGKILAALDDPNNDGDQSDSVAANTIVIFASDNGPNLVDPVSGYQTEFFDSNSIYAGAKFLMGDAGTRTPFFVRWPQKIAPGATNNSYVGTFADILPTFAEIAGQDAPLGIDGKSMLSELSGGPPSDRMDAVGWLQEREIGPANPGGWAIRVGDWKLLKRMPTSQFPSVTYRLYNLAADPRELTDLSAARPDVVAALEIVGVAEGFGREPTGPVAVNPFVQEVKNTYFSQYKRWQPQAGSVDFLDAANWSGGTQFNGVPNDPEAMNWNSGPADNWLATIADGAAGTVHVSIDASASVLALELRGDVDGVALDVGASALLTARNGVRVSSGSVLRLHGGEINTVRDLEIRSGGRFEGEGLINGQQHVVAGISELANRGLFEPNVVNRGELSVVADTDVNFDAGRLLIQGDYLQDAAATLNLDLLVDGPTPGWDFDQLAVTGAATLAGALKVSVAYLPDVPLGASYELITAAGGISGFFNSISAPALGGGLTWSIQYLPTSVVLRVVEQPSSSGPGYLAKWRQSFGVSAEADLDFDGDTDGADFLLWQRGLGTSPGSQSARSIPEPSCAMLACAALLVVGAKVFTAVQHSARRA